MDVKELMNLPLFLGMNKDELENVREDKGIQRKPVKRGMVIAGNDESCRELIIVVKGRLACTTHSDDYSYEMVEHVTTPAVIQPERLFGLYPRYSATFTALTPCEVMVIDKMAVLRLTEMSMTFRLNMLNLVATQCQRQIRKQWHQWPEEIEQRVVRFVKDRVLYPAGYKSLSIHMDILGRELGCSRLEISEALHSLEDKELIIIRRGKFEIPMMERL